MKKQDMIKIKLEKMQDEINFCMRLNNSTIKNADAQLKKESVAMASECYWEALKNQAETNLNSLEDLKKDMNYIFSLINKREDGSYEK